MALSFQDKIKPVPSSSLSFADKIRPVVAEPTTSEPPAPSPYDTGSFLTSPIIKYKRGDLGTVLPKAIANLPTASIRTAEQIGSGILNIFNPDFIQKQFTQGNTEGSKNTLVNLSKFGSGLLEKGFSQLFGKNIESEDTKTVDAVKQGILDRYGSWENVKRTIAEDPTGLLLDISSLMEGGGALISRAGLKNVGTIATDIGKTINPIRAGLKTAGAILEKGASPFAKSYIPEAAEQFKDVGITPPISAITESRFLRGAESLASKSVFGRKISSIISEASDAITKTTQEVIDIIKPQKMLSDENLGKTIQEGFRKYEETQKITFGKLYDAFSKIHGKSKAIVENTLRMAKEIVGQQSMDLYKGVNQRILKMVENLYSSPRSKKAFTFENLKSTRTSIGEELAKDPSNTALKRLYGALTEDMDRTVSVFDEDAGKQLRQLNSEYALERQKIESQLNSSIEKSNPERIAQNIIKRNSADAVRSVKEIIGPERFNEISKAFMRKLFEDANVRGKFNIDKLKSLMSAYDEPTLAEILTHDQRLSLGLAIGELERMEKLTQLMRPGQKILEGSQTAYLLQAGATGGRAYGLIRAFLTGNISEAVLILGELGAEYAGTKLFTSDIGRKLITEGLPKISNIGSQVKKVGDFPYSPLPFLKE